MAVAAGLLDRIVGLFQTADGARKTDDMRAFGREADRRRLADAARRAGDERDAPCEELLSCVQATSARRESWTSLVPPVRSVSSIGYSPEKQASQNCGASGIALAPRPSRGKARPSK